jgi:uncharacterized membrane protein YphA (DoxX/SURF4 family)
MNDLSINDVAYVIQLAVGIVFLAAGISKTFSGRAFTRVVRDYAVLPVAMTISVAGTVILFELFVGISLLSGLVPWIALALAIALVVSFIIAVGVNLLRGRKIACGCFGSSDQISLGTLVRLIVLLVGCVAVPTLVGIDPAVTTWSLLGGGGFSVAYMLDAVLLSVFLVVVVVWLSRLSDLRALFALQPARTQADRGRGRG